MSKGADFDDTLNAALMSAPEGGHTETVEILISNGADINTVSNYGTALMIASMNGNTETVEILIANGVN